MTEAIESLLASAPPDPETLSLVLDRILTRFDCVVGTIHRLERDSGKLHLCAQRGLPDQLLPVVKVLPVGKGMAGLAAERGTPVQVCNLQQDSSGDARPGAKLTHMEGSISLPMLVDGEVRGTLGVAKPTVYEFTADEIVELQRLAETIGRHLG